MSYTTINGMRSTRFPLQGDCGCPAMGPCPTSLRGEEEVASVAAGATAGGLLLLFGVGALLLMSTGGKRRAS